MSANLATMEAFRDSEVFWSPVEDPFAVSQKKIAQGLAEGRESLTGSNIILSTP